MFSDLYLSGRDLWSIDEWVRQQVDKPTALDIERALTAGESFSSQQSYEKWIAAYDAEKWSETIRHTKETLTAFWRAFDDATKAINAVKEIRPSADPAEQWKAQAVLLLLKVGNSFMRFNDARGGAVEFVCHWRLPVEWVDWLNQLLELERELRAVNLVEATQLTDDDSGKTIGQSDTKSDKQKKLRQPSKETRGVDRIIRNAKARGETLSKDQAIEQFQTANPSLVVSPATVKRELTDLWKSDKNRTS